MVYMCVKQNSPRTSRHTDRVAERSGFLPYLISDLLHRGDLRESRGFVFWNNTFKVNA
jgi:hypothetical protein